jgi:hypothetical protein
MSVPSFQIYSELKTTLKHQSLCGKKNLNQRNYTHKHKICRLTAFAVKFYQTFKEEITSILDNEFQKTKKEYS